MIQHAIFHKFDTRAILFGSRQIFRNLCFILYPLIFNVSSSFMFYVYIAALYNLFKEFFRNFNLWMNFRDCHVFVEKGFPFKIFPDSLRISICFEAYNTIQYYQFYIFTSTNIYSLEHHHMAFKFHI